MGKPLAAGKGARPTVFRQLIDSYLAGVLACRGGGYDDGTGHGFRYCVRTRRRSAMVTGFVM
jgi:hypothetical protein